MPVEGKVVNKERGDGRKGLTESQFERNGVQRKL